MSAATTTAEAHAHAAQPTEQHSRTTHIVTFPQPITLDEFRSYCEGRKWFGYHPAGYGGYCTVRDNVGVYTHSTSCD